MAGPYYTKVPSGTIGSGSFRGLYVVSSTWAIGDIVVPTVAYGTATAKGYIYRCTTAGTGSGTEPTWVYTTPGTSTTTDGAVWTCELATTWAYASPRPDYIINTKLANNEIVYSEAGTYTLSTSTTITMPGAGSQWLSTTSTTNAPPTSLSAGVLVDSSAIAGSSITISGNGFVYGVNLKNGGSSNVANITLAGASANNIIFENCTFTIGNSNASSRVIFGVNNAGTRALVVTRNCTFVFGATGQGISVYVGWEDYSSTFAATGLIPTTLMRTGPCELILMGSILTAITGTLFASTSDRYASVRMVQCRLGAGVAVLAAGGAKYDGDIYLFDCASGDTHYEFAHYNALGNTTISTAIYISGTDGASYNVADSKHSWKVTGVSGTFGKPYISPWISKYNEGVSAVTPRIEVMRDNNSTAYKSNEVWAEFTAKITTGYSPASIDYSDRSTILENNGGTAANQSTSSLGAGDWVGETGTPWFGKLEPSAAITPAEIGDICARVCVVGANTVYVNPKILGV